MNTNATKFDPTPSRDALRATEEERTRLAYLRDPDAESEADDWSNAEKWRN